MRRVVAAQSDAELGSRGSMHTPYYIVCSFLHSKIHSTEYVRSTSTSILRARKERPAVVPQPAPFPITAGHSWLCHCPLILIFQSNRPTLPVLHAQLTRRVECGCAHTSWFCLWRVALWALAQGSNRNHHLLFRARIIIWRQGKTKRRRRRKTGHRHGSGLICRNRA